MYERNKLLSFISNGYLGLFDTCKNLILTDSASKTEIAWEQREQMIAASFHLSF